MRGKECVPILFIRGDFAPESLQAGIVRAVGLFQHFQAPQVARLNVWGLVQPPIHAEQDQIRGQNDDHAPADDYVTMLNALFHF